MINFNQVQSVILDCDGVIFDSNSLKTKAFEKTLIDYNIDPVHISRFIEYHKQFGGVSRYIKFEYLIKEILCISFENSFYESLLKKYSDKSFEAYLEASFTDGCVAFLDKVSKNNIKLFVASGSDEAELREIFKVRKIDQYFTQIFGSPKTKYEILENFILPGFHKNMCIMIGDAVSDMESSAKAGIKAIAMKQYSENLAGLCESAERFGFENINNLKELI